MQIICISTGSDLDHVVEKAPAPTPSKQSTRLRRRDRLRPAADHPWCQARADQPPIRCWDHPSCYTWPATGADPAARPQTDSYSRPTTGHRIVTPQGVFGAGSHDQKPSPVRFGRFLSANTPALHDGGMAQVMGSRRRLSRSVRSMPEKPGGGSHDIKNCTRRAVASRVRVMAHQRPPSRPHHRPGHPRHALPASAASKRLVPGVRPRSAVNRSAGRLRAASCQRHATACSEINRADSRLHPQCASAATP